MADIIEGSSNTSSGNIVQPEEVVIDMEDGGEPPNKKIRLDRQDIRDIIKSMSGEVLENDEVFIRTRTLEELNGLEGGNSKSRMGSMLDTGFYSDCKIITDDGELKAHKFILAVMSPVMEKALCGPLGSNDYRVNFSNAVMTSVLKSIYQQPLPLTKRSDVEALLTAAHFFQMGELINTCGYFLRPKNVGEFAMSLNSACFYHITTLKEACIEMALLDIQDILTNADINTLSTPAIKYFVEKINNAHDVNHKLLIERVVEWIYSNKANLERQPSSLRNALEEYDLFDKLKFHKMKESDFLSSDYFSMFSFSEFVEIQNKNFRDRLSNPNYGPFRDTQLNPNGGPYPFIPVDLMAGSRNVRHEPGAGAGGGGGGEAAYGIYGRVRQHAHHGAVGDHAAGDAQGGRHGNHGGGAGGGGARGQFRPQSALEERVNRYMQGRRYPLLDELPH